METDWSVAAAADDPLIELPWNDAATGLQYRELSGSGEVLRARIAELPEAAQSPALAGALLQLNDPAGVLTTTKCDRWKMDATELPEHADLRDQPPAQHGCASYIDVLLRHPVPMSDFLLHEEWARLSALRCAGLAHADARLDLIIRPARMQQAWGYGMSVYIYAAGSDRPAAEAAWASALLDCTAILCAAAAGTMVPPEEASPNETDLQ